MPHTGIQPRGYCSLEEAISNSLFRLYKGIPSKVQLLRAMQQRNEHIRRRYANGDESIPDLAKVFGLSNARIHQILHDKHG